MISRRLDRNAAVKHAPLLMLEIMCENGARWRIRLLKRNKYA